jgi:butyryl-CoA dehydrogenase
MVTEISPAHRQLQGALRRFVSEAVLPHIMAFEEASVFPAEMFRAMGREGFLRAHVPVEEGGLGLGAMAFCIVAEELARGGAGMVHPGQFQTMRMLLEHGSPEQKERYLAGLLDGTILAATAITESEVGSSFARMQTRGIRSGSGFVLNGAKSLINDAAEADLINVFAATEEGISVFLIEKGTPGFRILGKQDPLGMRSSPVYEFELRDCPVDAGRLVGAPGRGLQTFFTAFNFSRLGNASAALGIAQAAMDKTIAYLKERRVGDHPASSFQGLRWKLAELDTEIRAARLFRDHTSRLADETESFGLESSQTKLLCVETANRVVGACIQATGRFGCLRDSMFDIYLRDARVLGTAGGSLEIMKNNIARHLLGNP